MPIEKPKHILNNRQLLALLIKRANDYFSFPKSIDLYTFEILENIYAKPIGNRELNYFEVNIIRNKTVIYSYQQVANKHIDDYIIDIAYKELIILVISSGLMIEERDKYFKEPINLP